GNGALLHHYAVECLVWPRRLPADKHRHGDSVDHVCSGQGRIKNEELLQLVRWRQVCVKEKRQVFAVTIEVRHADRHARSDLPFDCQIALSDLRSVDVWIEIEDAGLRRRAARWKTRELDRI